jgi:hypothetical protein
MFFSVVEHPVVFNINFYKVPSYNKFTDRRWMSPGMLRRVVWCKFTDVSKVFTISIIRAATLSVYTSNIFIIGAVKI